MGTDAAELLARALTLPEAARAALADSLIESLDGPVDEDAEQAWKHEVALRLRELDSGAVQSVAWDDVRRQLRSRIPA
jgi:putative addiction module component (TIGR02574 family)